MQIKEACHWFLKAVDNRRWTVRVFLFANSINSNENSDSLKNW